MLSDFQLPFFLLHPFLSIFCCCFAWEAMQAQYLSIELEVRKLGSWLGTDTNLLRAVIKSFDFMDFDFPGDNGDL